VQLEDLRKVGEDGSYLCRVEQLAQRQSEIPHSEAHVSQERALCADKLLDHLAQLALIYLAI
jgi:hypothetical protein